VAPKLVEVGRHPNIQLHTLTEVLSLDGEPGNFKATLRVHPRYVDMDRCIACGLCAEKCPRKVADAFNGGLGTRKAAYIPYAQAVPLKYAIDAAHCIYFEKGKCRACERFCPAGAIDFSQKEKTLEVPVGAAILAAGLESIRPLEPGVYGYGHFANVVTDLQMERILSATGPFQGHLVRPSDQRTPKKIAWIQCAGSRATHPGTQPYCSAVCCMYSVKQAMVAREHEGSGLDTALFFIDMRAQGKDFDRYVSRAEAESGVRFIRSRIHSMDSKNGGETLRLLYADDTGQLRAEEFDLVVLATGLQVSREARELASRLKVNLDADGFVATGCLNPCETSRSGVYVCGGLAGPADIPLSVLSASAASAAIGERLAPSRNTLIRKKTYPPEETLLRESPRIGVFVCHCGSNIAGVVDVASVRDYAATLPGVVYATDTLFTCSQDTQGMIADRIRENRLNRVVIAACTPRTHEPLFQETLRQSGINPYCLEFANIRDQDAWVHQKAPEQATIKAKDLVRMAVSKAALLEPVANLSLDMHKAALVVGGGVAGMTAALNLAGQGFPTTLVEEKGELGGTARNLTRTWKGENVQAYLDRLIERVESHPRIQVFRHARIERTGGFVGNFTTTIASAGEVHQLEHGVTVLATGGAMLTTSEYAYGTSDRVTCWHELEDLFRREPERLREARAIALIQCVGSREPQRPHCSRICCTASVQQAIALKTRKPDLDVYILYRELRTYGQREALYRKARELGVLFFRHDPESKPEVRTVPDQEGGGIKILLTDHVLNVPIALHVDYLNLYTAIVPGSQETVASQFRASLDNDGFILEAHMKLRPVDLSTEGVFVCGLAHYPKPLEESILQAQAAASRAATILVQERVEVQPLISVIDPKRCMGCGFCEAACPYGAIHLQEAQAGGYCAELTPALCKGCGVCAAGCPQKAIDMVHFRDHQIFSSIQAGGQNAMDLKRPFHRPERDVQSVSGYIVARRHHYHRGHAWAVRDKGGRIRVGMDDFAAKVLGPPGSIVLPATGVMLRQDREGWQTRRNRHLARFLAPVTGRVFAVNPKVLERPETIAEDPYGEGWLMILDTPFPATDLDHLYQGNDSVSWLEEEQRKLLKLLGPEYEKLAATGGPAVKDLYGQFPEIDWEKLVRTFLHTEP
jgi:heterodisulfide reductase subunit A